MAERAHRISRRSARSVRRNRDPCRIDVAGSDAKPTIVVLATHRFHTHAGIGSRDAGLHAAMAASDTATPDLGRFGFCGLGPPREQALEIERLGSGTIWVGGSPPAELSAVEAILE